MRPKSWLTIGISLAMLWAFFFGYFMALAGVTGISWSVRELILHFPKGGMTGYLFVTLFNIVILVLTILTVAVFGWTIISMKEEK